MSKLDLIIERQERVLFLDAHNAIFRLLHISEKSNLSNNIEDPTFAYFKFMYLKNILTLIEQFNATKVIVAIDSKKNWRKERYPEYKANRKVARDKSTFDFATFFPILDTFLEDLKSTFTNIYFLKIDACEGDDIIGHLTKYYHDQEIPSIIVSTDRDMNQLLKYKLVKQYDPAKKKMFEVLNPAVELECKIIMGDKGDNIPAIKPKCGPATASALIKKDFIHDIRIMEDKIEAGIISPTVLSEEQTLNREYLKNYYRNQELIDLSFIPQDIKTTIETELNNYPLEKFNSRKVLNLLVKHRMAGFIDTISELTATMNKIG